MGRHLLLPLPHSIAGVMASSSSCTQGMHFSLVSVICASSCSSGRITSSSDNSATSSNRGFDSCLNFSYSDGLADRLLSNLSSSTSGISTSSSSDTSGWLSKQQYRSWCSRAGPRIPPCFASISASSSIGQLRQQHTGASAHGSSSNSNSNSSPEHQQADNQQQQQQRDEAYQRFVEEMQKSMAPDVFKQGDVLAGGRYKLKEKISAAKGLADGRFTTVWEGEDTATGSKVILKCLEAGDNDSYTVAMREAALHATAGRHPNIVALLDAFEHRSKQGRHAVMVMESCGTNLAIALGHIDLFHQRYADYLAKHGGASLTRPGLTVPALKQLARHTLSALDHLHGRGLVMMDLSPDNILLDKDFQLGMRTASDALFGNFFKSLWNVPQMAFAHFLKERDPEAADSLLRKLEGQMESAQLEASQHYHSEDTLPRATFKLTDFGRAAPYKQLLHGLPASADAAASPEARAVLQHDVQYNRDGLIVLGNPLYRPPEEILAMDYIAPSYDMWRLGCLLYEAASNKQLFEYPPWLLVLKADPNDTKLRAYGDNDFHLLQMVRVFGNFPRKFVRNSPRFKDFFIGKESVIAADALKISNPIDLRPGSTPISMKLGDSGMTKEEILEFEEFITPLLAYDPADRPSAAKMLQHKWLEQGSHAAQQRT